MHQPTQQPTTTRVSASVAALIASAPEITEAYQQHYQSLRAYYFLSLRRFSVRTRGHDPVTLGTKKVPRWDGGRDSRSGVTYRAVWPRLSAFAYSRGVSPFLLLDAGFASWVEVRQSPQPSYFMTEVVVQQAFQFRMDRATRVTNAAQAQCERLISRILPVYAYRRQAVAAGVAVALLPIVRDALRLEQNCSALVCLVVAQHFDQSVLVLEYLARATLEYLECPEEWDQALGERLPEEVKEYSREYVIHELRRCSETNDD